MNRRHRRKRAASSPRRWSVIAIVAVALGGVVWTVRTAIQPHLQDVPDAMHTSSDGQRIQQLVEHVARCRAENRIGEARGTVRQLADMLPNDPRWWRLLAELCEEQGDLVGAVDTYRDALQHALPPADELFIRHRLVDQLVFLGDAAAARGHFEELRSVVAGLASPELVRQQQTRLQVEEANLLRLEGKPEQALASLDHALATLGVAPLALRLRGIILLDLGEVENAARDLERAVRDLPYDEVAHYKLAAAYRRLGRREDADRHLQKYQQIHDAHLEIQRITRDAENAPLSDVQRQRLAELYLQVGDG